MITWGNWYWPGMLIFTAALAFGTPEMAALAEHNWLGDAHTDNTLSNYARTQLNVSRHLTIHTVAWWVSLVMWLVFVVTITAHIWWDQLG